MIPCLVWLDMSTLPAHQPGSSWPRGCRISPGCRVSSSTLAELDLEFKFKNKCDGFLIATPVKRNTKCSRWWHMKAVMTEEGYPWNAGWHGRWRGYWRMVLGGECRGDYIILEIIQDWFVRGEVYQTDTLCLGVGQGSLWYHRVKHGQVWTSSDGHGVGPVYLTEWATYLWSLLPYLFSISGLCLCL